MREFLGTAHRDSEYLHKGVLFKSQSFFQKEETSCQGREMKLCFLGLVMW